MAERRGFEPLKAITPWRFSRPLVSTNSRIFPWLQLWESNKPLFLGYEPSEITVSLSCGIYKVLVIKGVSTDITPVGF